MKGEGGGLRGKEGEREKERESKRGYRKDREKERGGRGREAELDNNTILYSTMSTRVSKCEMITALE